jgi:GNAT superfamily N-acetyltransferase
MGKLTYKIDKPSFSIDEIAVNLYEDNDRIGYSSVQPSDYWFFADDINEDDYYEKINLDDFLILTMINVNRKKRGQGYGNKLIKLTLEKLIPKHFKNYTHIFLHKNAFDINVEQNKFEENEILDIFYRKHGFVSLLEMFGIYVENVMVKEL